MKTRIQSFRLEGVDLRQPPVAHLARSRRPHPVSPPRTPLLAHALPRLDWSDAYALHVPGDTPPRDPQDWADAVFQAPPSWVRVLFGVRELLVRAVGIERGNRNAFDTVSRTADEVLLGIDQRHLSFRASVLVEPSRVVLTTVVELHNRRGAAYFALVGGLHPLIVRSMLARAARKLDTRNEARPAAPRGGAATW